MKKLLFLLLVVIGFTACGPTVTKDKLPIEVVTIKEQMKFDTTLTIPTDTKTYVFDKNKEYVGAYKNEVDVDVIGGLFVGIVVAMLLMLGFIILSD